MHETQDHADKHHENGEKVLPIPYFPPTFASRFVLVYQAQYLLQRKMKNEH